MDLRSPEYIAAQRFFKPPVIALITVLAFIIFIVAGLQAANYYKNSLHTAINTAEESVAKLQITAEPLLTMKENLETVKARKRLLDEINNDSKPLASQLNKISGTSTAGRVELQRISVTNSGDLVIEGYVKKAKDAAVFNQQLTTLSFIGSCQVNKIDLSGTEKYLFIINGKFKPGDTNEEE